MWIVWIIAAITKFVLVYSDHPLLPPEKHYLLLSGPSQASTLLTNIFLTVPGLGADQCVHCSCDGAKEAFNPACQHTTCNEGTNGIPFHLCMGHESDFNKVWWHSCPINVTSRLVYYAVDKHITLTKDNFGVMKLDMYVNMGWNVIVAWRAAWETFPAGWYPGIWTSLEEAELHGYPHLALLKNFTSALLGKQTKSNSRCKPVMAHYIMFYQLITSAWRRKQVVLSTTKILLLPNKELRLYYEENLPRAMFQASGRPINEGLDLLVNSTLRIRNVQGRSHNNNQINNSSSNTIAEQIVNNKRHSFHSFGCNKYLADLSDFCEKVTPFCKRYNDYIQIREFLHM